MDSSEPTKAFHVDVLNTNPKLCWHFCDLILRCSTAVTTSHHHISFGPEIIKHHVQQQEQ
jgi:hypothetical protein